MPLKEKFYKTDKNGTPRLSKTRIIIAGMGLLFILFIIAAIFSPATASFFVNNNYNDSTIEIESNATEFNVTGNVNNFFSSVKLSSKKLNITNENLKLDTMGNFNKTVKIPKNIDNIDLVFTAIGNTTQTITLTLTRKMITATTNKPVEKSSDNPKEPTIPNKYNTLIQNISGELVWETDTCPLCGAKDAEAQSETNNLIKNVCWKCGYEFYQQTPTY